VVSYQVQHPLIKYGRILHTARMLCCYCCTVCPDICLGGTAMLSHAFHSEVMRYMEQAGCNTAKQAY
jgi:hypothetical protein